MYRPLETDRAGAAAEVTLRDTVCALQHNDHWDTTFRGEGAVWRMWVNEIIRNQDRSTWDDAIQLPPPRFVACLLQPADAVVQNRLHELSRSARMAMDVINGT